MDSVSSWRVETDGDKVYVRESNSSTTLIGYRLNSAWRGGGGDESEVFSDYKDFSGWMIPTRIEHKEPKHTITEVVNSATFDDVADSTFNLPDGVKALLGKQH